MCATRETVACYRLYAANCVELARNLSDVDRRVFLLHMARDWVKLAGLAEKELEEKELEAAHNCRSAHGDPWPEPPPER
ncbi:MAG: hypothetical protein WCA56_12445 [Xanthobacteraceae bacterium]